LRGYTAARRAETDMEDTSASAPLGSPDGIDARTGGLYPKTAEDRPQYRTPD